MTEFGPYRSIKRAAGQYAAGGEGETGAGKTGMVPIGRRRHHHSALSDDGFENFQLGRSKIHGAHATAAASVGVCLAKGF